MKAQRNPIRIDNVLSRSLSAATTTTVSGGRFSHYRYLEEVYHAYQILKAERLLGALPRFAFRKFEIPLRPNWHPLRILIEATSSDVDARLRSRWTRALEFALLQEVRPDLLARFLKANDGVAGCARKAAKLAPKRARPRDDWAS